MRTLLTYAYRVAPEATAVTLLLALASAATAAVFVGGGSYRRGHG